ncbi:MAG: type II 3-dehydroquinate dehydratase [Cyanobacteriota bacterium]|nr:type II 3-dehydroquinate dehydratase [Cyanobacteriota bacterium]
MESESRLDIIVLHGPNLNLLGQRETNIYGNVTLAQINDMLEQEAKSLDVNLSTMQSNLEGELVDVIQSSPEKYQGSILNAAAYTHTSVAIRDAIAAVNLPTVEVHLSNIYRRESFRHHSYIASVAIGQVSGFGARSYLLGLHALVGYLRDSKHSVSQATS